jgi:hypothetical protein
MRVDERRTALRNTKPRLGGGAGPSKAGEISEVSALIVTEIVIRINPFVLGIGDVVQNQPSPFGVDDRRFATKRYAEVHA